MRDRARPNVVHWGTRTPVDEIATSVLVLAEIRHGLELKRRGDPTVSKTFFVKRRGRTLLWLA
jgi:toxin FitB